MGVAASVICGTLNCKHKCFFNYSYALKIFINFYLMVGRSTIFLQQVTHVLILSTYFHSYERSCLIFFKFFFLIPEFILSHIFNIRILNFLQSLNFKIYCIEILCSGFLWNGFLILSLMYIKLEKTLLLCFDMITLQDFFFTVHTFSPVLSRSRPLQ